MEDFAVRGLRSFDAVELLVVDGDGQAVHRPDVQ
jgi:hypothetical protein